MPASVSLRDEDRGRLFAYPFLFMTSNNPARLSGAEKANLREYLLRGGFLLPPGSRVRHQPASDDGQVAHGKRNPRLSGSARGEKL